MVREDSFYKKLLSCVKEHRLPSRFLLLLKLLKEKIGLIQYTSIVVETASLCNVRCVWCWMYYSNRKDMGLMSFENFKKFIDLNAVYLKSKEIAIIPYHRGEALIHPKFFEMMDYANEKGVRIAGIDTNLSMKLDIKRLAESPLSHILVNIGGTTQEVHQRVIRGSSFELVKNNLKELLNANKCNKSIFIKMNPTKHNLHQIKELPSFFKELGGDPKNAIIGMTGFSLPAEASKEEIDEFFKNVVSDEMEKYLRFTYDNNRNIVAKIQRCSFLIPTIKWDGKVTICCHDQLSRLNLGNVFETPMKDILKNKKYKFAEAKGKRKEFPFCKNCN